MTEQELTAKIEQLIAERDNFRQQANIQVGMYNGQIMVYQQLLAELKTPPVVDPPKTDPENEPAG